MSFLNELKRRNVLRVGAAYIVAAWLVIQVAETIFPLFGFGDTPARLVVIVLAIGFVPSLIISWVFEITPEGLKRDAEVVREDSITHITGKKLDRIILVVLALALAFFAFDRFVLVPARVAEIVEETAQQARSDALVESYGDNSIAVLPFVDMSPNSDQAYFSDGISEELLNLLAKVPNLRVIARTSSFSFKGKDVKVAKVARELNVDHVLEGSVRKDGNWVRITVQLIEARSETHLWSETYDRELEEIFTVQDDVAAAVVKQLKVKLLGTAPKAPRTTPEVHTMYLQARHMLRQDTKSGFLSGIELLEKALAIDPNYSPAWASMCIAYQWASTSYMRGDEAMIKMKIAIKELLRTDPDSAFAYSLLAEVARDEGNLKAAGQYVSKALLLTPNDEGVLNGVAIHLAWRGRWREAAEVLETLSSRHPLNTTYLANLGIAYIFDGRFESAQSVTDTALALAPGYHLAEWNRLSLLIFHTEEYEKALEFCEYMGDTIDSEPTKLFCQAIIFPKLGLEDKGDTALVALEQGFDAGVRDSIWLLPYPYAIARVYALNNQPELAFKWLEATYQISGTSGLSLAWNDWLLSSLHTDNRWQPFLEKVGVSEEQMRSIDFEVPVRE